MDAAKLDTIHTLLRLIHHRNKNQHGNTKWWKWLAILNRAVSKLVRAVSREDENPLNLYDPEPTAPADVDVDVGVGVGVYKEHLARHVIPRCYLAFSTVVADNQFAVLGVVLVSILADLASVVGGVRLDESLPDTGLAHGHAVKKEMEKEVTGKDEDKDKDKDRLEVGVTHPPYPAVAAAAEDVGEVVFRGNDAPKSTPGPDAASDSGSIVSAKRSTGSRSEGPSKKKKKSKANAEGEDTRGAMKKQKKGKKKNTIDDLFNGVL